MLCQLADDMAQVMNLLLPRDMALGRSEAHTSELQSRVELVCRLLRRRPTCPLPSLHDALPILSWSSPSKRGALSRAMCMVVPQPHDANSFTTGDVRVLVGTCFASSRMIWRR